ncbi:MAG: 4Fe-4S binding protein [Candidatus Stahlbacteria bacterium]|nr:4Fe-4S binding protein [Candidatus Stahlbacteria bacterium]
MDEKVAVLMCKGDNNYTYERFKYVGIKRCLAADIIAKGPKSCIYGCLSMGDCVETCNIGAIKMSTYGLPIIDDKKCNGCGKCVESCPRNIITLIHKAQKIYVACRSQEINNSISEVCKIGCTGCGDCNLHCPRQAINVVKTSETLSVWRSIDFTLCQNCGICLHECTVGTIADKLKARPKAMIGTKCDGCGECKSICPTNAIQGKKDEQHKIKFDICIGCGLCYKECKIQAITMAFSLGFVVDIPA